MKNLVVILGSNNNNLILGQHFVDEIKNAGHAVTLVDLVALDLPLYSTAAEQKGTPAKVLEQVELLQGCDGMAWVTPEYNGGIPPQVTNYIAWISRSGNADWRSCFKYKKAILASHSGSGGINVLTSLRNQLAYVGMTVVGHQVIVNSTKELNPDSVSIVTSQLYS